MVPASREPLYRRDGDLYVPSALTRGPWDPRAQHGGAPAALIAGALASLEGGAEMALARLSFDFLRPVPIAPLALDAAVEGGGRRVQRLRARLLAGDVEVCRATALRIRRWDALAQRKLPPVPVAPALPDDDRDGAATPPGGPGGFAGAGIELRFASGRFDTPGPATVWFRLRVPVVDDRPASPLENTVAAADFANGISSVLDWGTSLFINADLSIALEREPQGEWTCLDSQTHVGPAGAAISESVLFDAEGRIGRGVQSLLVDRRE
jgi:hypothetical protein